MSIKFCICKHHSHEYGLLEAKISLESCSNVEDLIQVIKNKPQLAMNQNDRVLAIYLPDSKTAFYPYDDISKIVQNLQKLPSKDRFLLVKVSTEHPSDSDFANHILKLLYMETKTNLVLGLGKKFKFCNREIPVKLVCDSLAQRHDFVLKSGVLSETSDRNVHPIPVLPGGPGSGKTRYLAEFRTSSRAFVSRSSNYSQLLKEAFEKGVNINIDIGSITNTNTTGLKRQISSLIWRELHSRETEASTVFIDGEADALDTLIDLLRVKEPGLNRNIFVLGLDNTDKLYSLNPDLFKDLIKLLGTLSCRTDIIFCPLIAGNIFSHISNSSQRPNFRIIIIPLPLLTFEETKQVVAEYSSDVEFTEELEQIIADINGQLRAIEILCEALDRHGRNWDHVMMKVRIDMVEYYSIDEDFKYPICFHFLHIRVGIDTIVAKGSYDVTFGKLADLGLLSLIDGYVSVPYILIYCYFDQFKSFGYLWYDVKFKTDWNFQKWEEFGRNFVAFRLFLYKQLNYKTVKVKDLFRGSLLHPRNCENLELNIPDDIAVYDFKKQYPLTKPKKEFKLGTFLLNGPSASFADSFAYIQTTTGTKYSLGIQSKYSQDKKNNITNKDIDVEYIKVEKALQLNFKNDNFILLMLCRRDGNIDPKVLPKNTYCVTMTEARSFFGDLLYTRIAFPPKSGKKISEYYNILRLIEKGLIK
jgi:hypothetical protein